MSDVLAVFGGLLLFEALHSKVLPLSFLLPVILIEDVFVSILVAMSVNTRYQVMVGLGTALLLTTHWNSFRKPSLIVSGLPLGIKETL